MKDNTAVAGICLLELREAFWVSSYAMTLVSVKRLTDKRALIHFNDDPIIKMTDRTMVLMMTKNERFSAMIKPVKTGSLATMSNYQLLASSVGTQKLARCSKIVTRCRWKTVRALKRRRTATSAAPGGLSGQPF